MHNVRMLLYFLLIFSEYLTNSNATRCFSCNHVANLTDCMTVETCSSNEECSSEQVVTNTAQIMFNTGCVLKSHCAVKMETKLRKRDDTDIITCLECCAGDFCNDKGCGVQVLTLQQTPALVTTSRSVNKMKMMQNAFEKNLRTCQVCDALSHTFVNVHCPANCCARDSCNDQCGKVSSQVTTTTAAPLTTPTTNAFGLCSPSPCVHGACINLVTSFICDCNRGYAGTFCEHELHDCKDIEKNNVRWNVDDIYVVRLNGQLVNIKCDMFTLGGGWTVLFSRQDKSVNFEDQDYSAYVSGFGLLHLNFWLGLEHMHAITGDGRRHQLRVELTVANGTSFTETYDDFTIGPPNEFVLHVGNHSGNAGDSLSGHNGFGFTTKDVDHDSNPGTNCAVYLHGAWWFHTCYDSCLTCPYLTPGTVDCRSFSWNSLSNCEALKAARVLVKPM